MNKTIKINPESLRAEENSTQKVNWEKWGCYLSERQWGTVREDYSEDGNAWNYFPHDHARSRVYRWGEDGIAGISDNFQNLCFALTLWNGKDPILKERLFGLTGPEGNHGEDCKELYYYLDNTPSHSYMKYLYKYPQNEYPYQTLVEINRNRSKQEPEFEILDTGLFEQGKYFDVFVEYAKEGPEDILIKLTIYNRGSDKAFISVLPTLWFRNLWSFGLMNQKPSIRLNKNEKKYGTVELEHETLGKYYFYYQLSDKELFTENESNTERLFQVPNAHPFVKDAFHRAVVQNDYGFLEGKTEGTKFSPLYQLELEGGEEKIIQLRLSQKEIKSDPFSKKFEEIFQARVAEADEFYANLIPAKSSPDLAQIQRQAFAGMLWSKQYYNIDIEVWLNGDKGQFSPPQARKNGRNHQWKYLNNNDILSMPDKWEYPWYAAWDLAFHCIPLAMIDPHFAKNQLILILREWYMAPNGQIPAYEWAFGDVNPPVQAWAALRVYNIEKRMKGKGDIQFLKRVFQKLMLNFTWWVNRKDSQGKNIFEGGFLGLDNIGIFDRSNKLPAGGSLEQADGTSWMGMYALNLMEMALEIATEDPSFEDVATKFFEHFIYIAESINHLGDNWTSLWDEEDGFFYDILQLPGEKFIPIKVRSLVGLTPLFAVSVLRPALLEKVSDFAFRLKWFREYRKGFNKYLVIEDLKEGENILLSMVNKQKLQKMLERMLDENEFLAPGGIRSVSRHYKDNYYALHLNGEEFGIRYEPAESSTGLFGGNSNWRGPIWLPMNFLLIESLQEYYLYYGDTLKVEFPKGSGNLLNLHEVARELSKRILSIFLKDKNGKRPVNGHQQIYDTDPHFQELILFYEYFHGDNSRGVGASHQTGWTGLVADLIDEFCWE